MRLLIRGSAQYLPDRERREACGVKRLVTTIASASGIRYDERTVDMTTPTAAFTRVVFPIAWRWPGRAARMLFEFALAEQATMLDMRAAAARTSSAERRALYLRHALDEGRHAHLFSNQSVELRAKRSLLPVGHLGQADSEQLFKRLGEVQFLAFVHLGERRACEKFEVIQAWVANKQNGVLPGALAGILRDEQRHTSYTRELLVELAGSEARARRAIRRAAAWDAWRRWRRWGNAMARVLYAITMIPLYVAIAPLALLVRLVRPLRPGWRRRS